MAWRFKASKYKNAAPIVPKPEHCVRDICIGSYQTYGNNIAASAKFMAFNWEHAGSSLAVLPLDDAGRKCKLMPLLHAHADTVTDLDFSPFHDGLLATSSQDCSVKIWHIPAEGLRESLSNCECTFSHKQRRVETVGFHPTANYLLHSTSYTTLALWDLMSQQELFANADAGDVIQSVSWKRDGTLLASSAKDKQVRVIDARAKSACMRAANSHQSIKDSRVVWLGDTQRVLTTGFDAQRLRQVIIRDVRMFADVEKSLELDCSTGVLMPLYDADTRMLFLAGKGDSTIAYMEVLDKEPFLVDGIRHAGEQTKGACLVPKRALNVMQGEVNRIMQLTSNSVIPITYQVPRKTYRDFHSDLYPDTPGCWTPLCAEQWRAGRDIALPMISLDPAKRAKADEAIIMHKGNLASLKQDYLNELNAAKNMVVGSESIKELGGKVTKHDNRFEGDAAHCESNDCINGQHQCTNPIEQVSSEQGPPKPLPRTSRAGSISEPGEEHAAKPVARPRTNSCAPVVSSINPSTPISGGYKPRLGPKPFSAPKFAASESFNKVFAVPPVPGLNGLSVDHSMAGDATVPDMGDCKEAESSAQNHHSPTEPNKTIEGNEAESEAESEKAQSIAERRKMYERSQPGPDGGVVERPDGSPVLAKRKDSFKNRKNCDLKDDAKKASIVKQMSCDPSATPSKRTSTVFGRVSKFRHLKGTTAHKSFHIENIRNLSRQVAGECDGFHANSDRVAVPLSGPGGKIAIFELLKTGRLPDGVIPALVHGSNAMDFQWDPFDNQRLAVACDDGVIKLWTIPATGLLAPTNTPDREFNAHADKIYFIKFHPTAKDVLASGSFDMTIRIWDLASLSEKIVLKGHTDQMFSFAWSPCGSFCATMCKDGRIRVYKPLSSSVPLREGMGPVGSRGARIVWALDGKFVVVMGFDKVSERQIMVFKSNDLTSPLNTVGLDVSPAILIPFYDEDSSTLFLTGKGDMTIYAFEVTEESPYICPLSHHRCNGLHQGLSFLPKHVCDVANVEFARALRLTNSSIEPLSFTVPRIKTDLFQDDLFPLTRVTWTASLLSAEWFGGAAKRAQRISLCPEGMNALSDSQAQPPGERIINKSHSQPFIGAVRGNKFTCDVFEVCGKNKQNELTKSFSSRVEMNAKLYQDEQDGVDEKEWKD